MFDVHLACAIENDSVRSSLRIDVEIAQDDPVRRSGIDRHAIAGEDADSGVHPGCSDDGDALRDGHRTVAGRIERHYLAVDYTSPWAQRLRADLLER